MTRQLALLVRLGMCLCPLSSAAGQQPARIGSLGSCRLSSGGTISDCRIGYRIFGGLSAARDNVVLIPTWLQGRSEDWIPLLGPRGYVDTTRFHVIIVDALGDGHSSSPSSLPEGKRRAFPEFSIADMVTSQYRLLTEKLGIKHLHAVVGFSMGGMQALEWAVRYPTFLDRAVPIAGAARLGAFDRLMWTATLQEIENGLRARIPADSVWTQLARLEALFLQTPAAVNSLSWDSVMTASAVQAVTYRKTWPLEDFAAQLKAIRQHDISSSFGGDMSRAAQVVRARVFIVHSPDDHMVTSGSAVEFAQMIGAKTLLLPSECGHIAIFCQQDTLAAAVRAFLESRER
jgi:homoserine O-acetyltransferase/O-succinyltransferase